MHTNKFNSKKYVGITKLDVHVRWNNGLGYAANKKFQHDISKYGWNGFDHQVIKENLNYLEAKELECKLIKKHNTIKQGYNNTSSGSIDISSFAFFDFATLLTEPKEYSNSVDYFTRIPNIFIQNNISKELGLNRIFLIVYILIDRNRTYEDKSYISIDQVLKLCGYKCTYHKPKIFYEVIKSLLFLKENYFINVSFDYLTIGYEECIKIEIIKDNFDPKKNFTKLYGKIFDLIMSFDSKITKESLLTTFLYISSYIGCRRKNKDGSEMDNAKDHPEAFWRSIDSMAKELSMSKDTINQCIGYLTQSFNDIPALLVKKEVGSVKPEKDKPPKNVPNIYVLNKEGYRQEIQWALDKMLDLYKVDEFYPFASGNNKSN